MDESGKRLTRIAAVAILMMMLAALFRHQARSRSNSTRAPASARFAEWSGPAIGAASNRLTSHFLKSSGPPLTAEQVVQQKLAQFTHNRRKLMRSLAKLSGKPVPPEVEAYFDAIENGRWEEAERIFRVLHEQHESGSNPDLYPIWRPIQETEGIQSESRHWPAEKLLEYGERTLGALRPGMVLMGGTDPGAFINTFMNETSEGEHHIIFTQNALADSTYLNYLRVLYGSQLNVPSEQEQQAAYNEYLSDLEGRVEHDRKFPNDPKQVRPDEQFKTVNGKNEASGQGAVMAVNERLVGQILQKNPDLSFALEESAPFTSTYANASMLGPVMELRAGGEALTSESAAAALDQWRQIAGELPALRDGEENYPNMAYAKMAAAQANLLLSRGLNTEAESAFQLARQMFPGSADAAAGLAELYSRGGRAADAEHVITDFSQRFPSARDSLASRRAAITARAGAR